MVAGPLALLAAGLSGSLPAAAAQESVAAPAQQLTYADLASLVDASAVVARVRVADQVAVEPERSPGLAPGKVRLYLETGTEALLKAPEAQGESLKYLVDVPLGAKGKVPKLKKLSFIVFAQAVPSRPGELQLVAPDAQLPADPTTEARVRAVIAELSAPDAPPRITGVRDAMSVAGNLAGESETQLFLDTANGTPVSLTVVRRPGMAPAWGVSWTEIVDQAARPPERGTAAWYRLACFLPRELPDKAYLQRDNASRAQARADYTLVIDQLGQCSRTR
ncbi:hypothetical protein GRI89_12375 [Altererythrobacter salegens]|uniref:Uncharacterized protein n=1 Tax=Croceibacterium salegens TaxID=1737568 RepID=A0A6I4SWD6_9SPHN|nr:hypothetical protein [Croceibacterium salegens]